MTGSRRIPNRKDSRTGRTIEPMVQLSNAKVLLVPMDEVIDAIAAHIHREHPVCLVSTDLLTVRFGVKLRGSDTVYINITDLEACVSLESLEPPCAPTATLAA